LENRAKADFVGRLFLVLLQRSFSTTFSGFSFVSVEHLFDWRSRAEALNRPPNRTILGQALQDDNVRRICDSFCRGERLFARDWISVQALRDDSVAHCGMKQYVFLYRILTLHVILTMFLVRIPAPREKGTPIFAYNDQRFLSARSRAGASRDDKGVDFRAGSTG